MRLFFPKHMTILLIVPIVLSVFSGIGHIGAEGAGGSFGGGNGTMGNPFIIEDVWDLQNMTSDLSAHYVLKNDIDASATVSWNSGAGFVPVGTFSNWFTGSLDGKNHTITGLFINRSTTNNVGLFGCVNTTDSVKNVGLLDNDVTGKEYVGGLVGYNVNGTVNNSYATGNVTGNGDYIGGLVGYNIYGTVNNSYATGNVNGTNYYVGGLVGNNRNGIVNHSYATGNVSGDSFVGGLVGYNVNGTVNNSYATGYVSGTDSHIGGLVGDNMGTVTNSYATGNVNGAGYSIGGLVGTNKNVTVNNSYATGNVTGYSHVGGLVGNFDQGTVNNSYATGNVNGSSYIGGLVGRHYGREGSVSNSYATGNVSGTSSAGGFVGYYGHPIFNSYATGTVTRLSGTETTFGGFVGRSLNGMIHKCYSTGKVKYIGATDPTDKGFAGGGSGRSMKWNFWDNQTSLQNSTAGTATGKTTAEMKTRTTFTNARWDFTSVWCIKEDVSYPLLRWQDGGYPLANAGPDQVIAPGTLVTFDGRGSSDTVGLVSYTWTFIDGTPVKLYGVQPTHRFNNYGIFLITLKVTNKVGNWASDTMNVSVLDLIPPVADAGPDQIVDEGTFVTFDGSGSSDNRNVVNWTWTFNDGIEKALFGVKPTYRFRSPGVIRVILNVTDEAGNWNMDRMYVTVNDITPPVADAGPDQVVDEGSISILDGRGSTDNVGIVNYTWTFNDGTDDITLYGAAPSHTFSVPGVYTVTLNVIDAAGLGDVDALNVTVIDNTPPVSAAGPDQTVDEGALVTFNGSGSTDNVGIVNYTWTFNDGTDDITLHGAAPSHNFSVPGVYTVTLNVTDDIGLTGSDVMTVTVIDITSPVAHAGPDQTVDEDTMMAFDGTASVDNVGITNYTWTFMGGTGDITLHGEAPSHTFSVPGVYTVTLNVTDDIGLTGSDVMTVTVIDITPPSANAGPDQTVDEDTMVAFDGSASLDNVGITNYTWTFMGGNGDITLHGAAPSHTFSLPGVYTVTLNVTDDIGLTGSDVMTVTVIDITPPSANAGPDQTVDEDTMVAFDGSASLDNVGITNYTWTFMGGTSDITLHGEAPSHTFDDPGTYEVTLAVEDAVGNVATDVMTVTVLDATPPIADAGEDIVTDQHATVTFEGSGSFDNVGILSWTWTFEHDGEPQVLRGTSPEFTFHTAGVYLVTLGILDASVNYGEDTVTVTVLDIDAPVADAGQDLVFVEGDKATFDGSGSADNVGIVSWTWRFVHIGFEETLEGETVTFIFEEDGEYLVTLEVADAAGLKGTDTMTVTIQASMPDPDPPPDDGEPVRDWSLVALYAGVAAVIVIAVLVALLLIRRRS